MSKQNIQIIIMLICFAAAGLVLYNGFFKSNSPSELAANAAVAQSVQTPQSILPYGNSLDFSVLTSRPFQFGQVRYQQVSPGQIGIPPQNLIQAPATAP